MYSDQVLFHEWGHRMADRVYTLHFSRQRLGES